MQNLLIYKASAGSGKTHLLTQNYLRLAFKSPLNFMKILAVTFTNKAAEEMKNRIIDEINSIVELKNEAAHFPFIKSCYPDKSEQEIYDNAKKIRENILHNYSQFSVSTIDSFVQKVVRAFAFEIGLAANYQIEMDNEKVIAELTEMLYFKISGNKQLQKWLIRFANFKIKNGKNWDFRAEIGTLAKEIFKERFQSFQPFNFESQPKQEAKNKEKLTVFIRVIQEIIRLYEMKMNKLSENATKIISEAHINKDNLGLKFKTIANYFLKKILAKDYDPYSTKTMQAAVNGLENWHNKKYTPKQYDAITSVYPAMLKLVNQAFETFDNENTNYITAQNTLANFHSFGILNDIAALLPTYRKNNNVLLISDTTLLLKEIIKDNDAPFIYEKIGNRFSNILIDEFQDTSTFQWANFKPLIKNALAEEFFNLIVGDVKQSIYRWRAGDWKLLLNGVSQQIGKENIAEKTLEHNWRSKENIVNFNNAIFKYASQILQNQFNADVDLLNSNALKQAIESENLTQILTKAYQDSYQKLPKVGHRKGGCVSVQFIASKTKADYANAVGEMVALQIDKLLTSQKYAPKDLTILVRSHNEGQEMVRQLMRFQEKNPTKEKYSIISAQSLYLDNSPVVRIIVNAMKYLYNSQDSLTLSSLFYDYFTLTTPTDKPENDFIFSIHTETQQIQKELPDEFLNNKEEIKRKSLFEISENLIRIFKLNKYPTGHPYLRAFQDAIIDYTRNNSSNLGGFIEWWNEKGKLLSVQLSDKQNAVKVVTIHHSKGLAYKVVIMPFVNWNIDHSFFVNAPIIWAKSKENPYNSYEYLPIKYKKELANSFFSKDYFDEKLYASMDAINMLYVAFTRAINELHLFAPINQNADKCSNVGDLLKHSILASKGANGANGEFYQNLNKQFNKKDFSFLSNENYDDTFGKYPTQNEISSNFETSNYPNYEWNDRISINYSSNDFFIESVEAVGEKVNYGVLMHRIFSEITVPDDVENALDKLLFSGYITELEKVELSVKVKNILERPAVKPWFLPENEIITEKEILTHSGEIRIPDRVIITPEKIIVVDFKFGEIKAEYVQQITEYQALIADIYKQKVQGILYYAETDTLQKF